MSKADWAKNWQEQFLERVRTGLRSLESIASDKDMPHKDTIYEALKGGGGFSDDYARAREARGDHLVQEAAEIAATATPENVQVARVQIDLKKWTAARMAPKQYGDKVRQEHTSPDGSMTPHRSTRDELIEQAKRLGVDPAVLGLTGGPQKGD